MEKNFKIINRIFQYLEFKGIPPTRLEKEIGLSNGYLGTQLKRNADIGESVLLKIIDNCRDLNYSWLILGKGEMILNTIHDEVSIVNEPIAEEHKYKHKKNPPCKTCKVKDELIESLKATIAAQKLAIDVLTQSAEEKRKND